MSPDAGEGLIDERRITMIYDHFVLFSGILWWRQEDLATLERLELLNAEAQSSYIEVNVTTWRVHMWGESSRAVRTMCQHRPSVPKQNAQAVIVVCTPAFGDVLEHLEQ
jgi:hypothetical protein